MRLAEWLRSVEDRLAAAGIESARLEAQVLAAHGLGQDRAWVLAHFDSHVDPRLLAPLVDRRLRREPLAYIVGYREFFGHRFNVTPDVLIPRQETETLVEAALDAITTGRRILDLGTGSGCVAISIALARPDFEICASDVSAAALEVARRNAAELGADVLLVRSDLFDVFADERFDVIVSNPPYVETGAELQPEVHNWEPNTALFAGDDGLDFYRRLAAEASHHLTGDGRLIIEIGDAMKDAVAGVFEFAGWQVRRVRKDLSGMDRALMLTPKYPNDL